MPYVYSFWSWVGIKINECVLVWHSNPDFSATCRASTWLEGSRIGWMPIEKRINGLSSLSTGRSMIASVKKTIVVFDAPLLGLMPFSWKTVVLQLFFMHFWLAHMPSAVFAKHMKALSIWRPWACADCPNSDWVVRGNWENLAYSHPQRGYP